MIRGGMTVGVKGWRGIAFYVVQARKGTATVVMVGDDRKRNVDVDDCFSLARKSFCQECGQIGCGH